MSIDERTLAVIQSLYDAAVDETLWPRALRELTELTESQAASFWVLDGSDQPRLPTFECINFDPKAIEEYVTHTAQIDPTIQYLVRHPNLAIVHDGLIMTEREKDRHPYYDWHTKLVETRFRMVGQVHPAPMVQAGVALHRTRRVGRYESNDIERFALLHRHLERALAIGFRLGSLASIHQCTTELLDRNPAAILLLDKHKQVVYANRAAEEFQSDRDGIVFSAEGISVLRRQDNDLLQRLIAQALPARGVPGMLRAHRPSGKRPYLILTAPISKRYPALSILRPVVCVVITDPDRQRILPIHRLRSAFGLTEAEAELAALLAGGEDLRSAAARLEITYGTARARLAEIFQKTETRRQGELIKLLLTAFTLD